MIKFNRNEFAGALGDLGTLIPLSLGLIYINGLNPIMLFTLVGLVYVITGFYFKLPIPIQPLKAVAIIAITLNLSPAQISAVGLLMGIILLIFRFGGLLEFIQRLFKKPIIRGIQLSIGILLIIKGISFALDSNLFFNSIEDYGGDSFGPSAINILIWLVCFLVILLWKWYYKLPPSILILGLGILLGLILNNKEVSSEISTTVRLHLPDSRDLISAFIFLVIPQLPLTLGNAVFASSDLANEYYSKNASKVTPKSLATSIGISNIIIGLLGGMPICHGAGGVAAHYRFGARTGGTTIMLGAFFIIFPLIFGKDIIWFLGLIPIQILGILLFFDGLMMIKLILNIEQKEHVFVAISMVLVTLFTKNLSYAMIVGLLLQLVLRRYIKA